jgi:hypothetical protein
MVCATAAFDVCLVCRAASPVRLSPARVVLPCVRGRRRCESPETAPTALPLFSRTTILLPPAFPSLCHPSARRNSQPIHESQDRDDPKETPIPPSGEKQPDTHTYTPARRPQDSTPLAPPSLRPTALSPRPSARPPPAFLSPLARLRWPLTRPARRPTTRPMATPSSSSSSSSRRPAASRPSLQAPAAMPARQSSSSSVRAPSVSSLCGLALLERMGAQIEKLTMRFVDPPRLPAIFGTVRVAPGCLVRRGDHLVDF